MNQLEINLSQENLRTCIVCYADIKSGYTCGSSCMRQLHAEAGIILRPDRKSEPAVYLVSSMEFSDMVKIGYSDNVSKRLPLLQIGSPVLLDLLCCFQGSRDLEKYLHGVFHARRRHGEWFSFPEGNVVALVRNAVFDYRKLV
jgi:hypothetical protein